MKLSHWEPDLRTLFNWIENGEIDLQPNFQRGDVWPSSKKRKLVDTILREWSIPPIHVVVTESGTLEVLDGQQRLTAIRDFMRDDFTIDGRIEPREPRFEELSGLHYSALPAPVRRAFDQYTLRVFRITDYKPEEPGELFYRLNQQIVLTAGEQRNALFGPARFQLKQLVSMFEEYGNRRENIGFSNARMAYDDVFAKLLFFLDHRSFAEKATESRISDRFKLQIPFSNSVIEWAQRTIELFSKSREVAVKVKLNKATLLSWFLFFCRFEHSQPSDLYLSFFEESKSARHRDTELDSYSGSSTLIVRPYKLTMFDIDVLSLFIDRSSLRVADISSVVYRDFAIWAVYVAHRFENIPSGIDVGSIERIRDIVEDRPDTSLEYTLDASLDLHRWASL